MIVNDGVEGEVGFGVAGLAALGHFLQVFQREVGLTVRAHVQLLHPEIDGVGATLQGCRQRFERPGRGHDLNVPVLQNLVL